MVRMNFIFSILIVGVLLASCAPEKGVEKSTTPNHDYYPEDREFTLKVTDADNAPYGGSQVNYGYTSIQARYTGKDIRSDEHWLYKQITVYVYHFETLDSGSQLNLVIPTDVAGEIKLTTGNIYRIVYQIIGGWETEYGLIITQGSDLVFAGVTDSRAGGSINIDDSFLPTLAPSIRVELSKVLADHYLTKSEDTFERLINIEFKFSLVSESVSLHQGESATLAGYETRLLIARHVVYKQGIVRDGWLMRLSYTIRKTSGEDS